MVLRNAWYPAWERPIGGARSLAATSRGVDASVEDVAILGAD